MKIGEVMYSKLSDINHPKYKHKIKNGVIIENKMTTKLQDLLSDYIGKVLDVKELSDID